MPDVKHMKWWGWGVEGVAFHHEDKPGFRPFVIEAVDLDVNVEPTAQRSLDPLDVPRPMIPAELVAELRDAVGPDNLVTTDDDRIVHTYGKSVRDLLRLRAGDIPRVPDVVVYPGSEEEVQLVVDRAVAANAVLIPFGGGSNISGSLQAPAGRDPAGDLGRHGPDEPGAGGRRGVRAGPDPGRRARPGPRGAARRPGLDPRPLPGQLHPQHARRLGRDPVLGHAVGQVRRHQRDHPRRTRGAAGQGAGAPAAAQHLDRAQRPGDDPRLGGPARHHHRGHRAGAPDPRGAADPRLPVPVLGRRAGRDAGDLDQRRVSERDPGVRRARDPLLLRHPEEVEQAVDHLAGQQGPDEGAGAARLAARPVLPVVHRLRGRQGARRPAEGDRQGHRRQARRHRAGQGSGRRSTTRRSSTPPTSGTSCSTAGRSATSPRPPRRGRSSSRSTTT